MLHDDVDQTVPDDVRVVQGPAELEKVGDGGEVPGVDVERDRADLGRRVEVSLQLVQGPSQFLDQPLGGVGISHIQHATRADTLQKQNIIDLCRLLTNSSGEFPKSRAPFDSFKSTHTKPIVIQNFHNRIHHEIYMG